MESAIYRRQCYRERGSGQFDSLKSQNLASRAQKGILTVFSLSEVNAHSSPSIRGFESCIFVFNTVHSSTGISSGMLLHVAVWEPILISEY